MKTPDACIAPFTGTQAIGAFSLRLDFLLVIRLEKFKPRISLYGRYPHIDDESTKLRRTATPPQQFAIPTFHVRLHVAHGTRGDSVEFEIESEIEELVRATW